MRCGQSSEGPQEPFAYRGSLWRFRARTGPSFIKAQSRHSLFYLVLPAIDKRVCSGRTVAGMRSLQAHLTRSRLATTKGHTPILNPYYLVHLMLKISTAEPIKDIIYDISGTGPPIPRRSCGLSRQLKFWTDRSHFSFRILRQLP